ncbi:MAG: hypothetical protein LBD78_06410 [Spirochaetaceae bacterium]|jgi:hypothetical protein|nr:hypothetical protein [Spirochaetaceae bacterium]
MIERIGEHYRANIANRFIRPLLLQLPMDKMAWDLVEVLTEKVDQYRYQGFDLDDLYRQIIATARFVALIRRELVPGLRQRVAATHISGPDKVMRNMAVNNFNSNLQVFADLVNELYINLVELDKTQAHGRMPIYAQMPELKNIGIELIGH